MVVVAFFGCGADGSNSGQSDGSDAGAGCVNGVVVAMLWLQQCLW